MRITEKIWRYQDPKNDKINVSIHCLSLMKKEGPCVYISKKYSEGTTLYMNGVHARTSRNHVRTYNNRWLIANLGQYSGIRMWLFLTIWKCLQMSFSGETIVIYNGFVEFLYQNCIRWDQNDPNKPGKYSGILVLSAININGIQLFYFRRVLWADFRTRTKRKIHNRRQWDALFWLNCNNERFGLK